MKLGEILIISDGFYGKNSFNEYLGTPKQKQNHSYRITELNERVLSNDNEGKVKKTIFSQLNRMTTVGLKLTDYSTIVENILKDIQENKYKNVRIEVTKNNMDLARFVKDSINEFVDVDINLVRRENFVDFSISRKLKRDTFKSLLMLVGFIGVLLIGFLYSLIFRPRPKKKVDLFWMSLASNISTVDEPIISMLRDKGMVIINPNLSLRKKIQGVSVFPVFSKEWPIQYSLIKDVFKITFCYKARINSIVNSISVETGYALPEFKYNSKLFDLLIHNIRTLLLVNLVEQYNSSYDKSCVLFRGGNADGLVYISSMKNSKVSLLPHATEFSLFDHNSHKFLSRNYLLSSSVVDHWNEDSRQTTVNIPVGRPFYDVLINLVGSKDQNKTDNKSYKVGIILTYGTNAEMTKFVDDIISAVNLIDSQAEIIIKHRPNGKHDLSNSKYFDSLIDFEGNIVDYLKYVDVNFVGANAVGTVGNVGNDAIVCNVPTVFYFGDRKLTKGELGYSWNKHYEDIAFYSFDDLAFAAEHGVKGLISRFEHNKAERRRTLIDNELEGKSHKKIVEDLERFINE
ncbi:hypothetical protein R7041_06915 [Vibrio sp. 1751]|nr:MULTISPECIES: hypothetical protein [unclassified Vibrio]MDW2097059.1 hypothetical protein [Vibrio sp. 1751]MDW2243753.1 hypothetical protein [Vibrio sp. 1287]